MKHAWVSILVGCGCLFAPAFSTAAPAGQTEPAAAPDGQRFLFVVDTSSGMERLQAASETAVYDLILTGVYGQMRQGDTYGLWTFNKQTYAGQFPMQVWDPRRRNQIATIAAAFVSEQTCEKSCDVKQLVENLNRVIRAVSNLNVFIISDGRSTMRGTAFDKAINADYKARRRERNAARQPFVTTFIAREGSIRTYSVTIAGQPILLPERPLPPVTISRKSVPPSAARGVLLSNNVIHSVSIHPSVLPARDQPPPPTPSASAEKFIPPLVTAPPVATNSPPPPVGAAETPSPTPQTAAAPVGQTPVIHFITSSNNLPAVTETANAATPLSSNSIPTGRTTEPPPRLAVQPGPPPSAHNAPTSAPVAEATSPSAATLAALLPDPIAVAAREQPAEADAAQSQPTPPVQAAGLPAQPGSGGSRLVLFGGVLLVAAMVLAFVGLRRSRLTPGSSLITQSMERH